MPELCLKKRRQRQFPANIGSGAQKGANEGPKGEIRRKNEFFVIIPQKVMKYSSKIFVKNTQNRKKKI